MSSSLHVHSAFSLLDGLSMPEENLKRASELGLKALAITEHGEVTSWPYYSELQSKYPDVKLLYGIETYECVQHAKQINRANHQELMEAKTKAVFERMRDGD